MKPFMTAKTIVLLSGGIDSTTTLAIARDGKSEVNAISFRYGQRHAAELKAAQSVAKSMGATRHILVELDLSTIGGSALTDDIAVPKNRTPSEIAEHPIPATYVPARNTIFLSYALAWAEVLSIQDIFIGVNALDYSGYPDCRPEYIAQFEKLANLATKAGVEGARIRIHTPLIQMTKAQIIQEGMKLGVDYALTHSCYDPTADGLACGTCDSCQLRLKGFHEAGGVDPIAYSASISSR
jgi:7-cyano-7-deazaguanine synthase